MEFVYENQNRDASQYVDVLCSSSDTCDFDASPGQDKNSRSQLTDHMSNLRRKDCPDLHSQNRSYALEMKIWIEIVEKGRQTKD
jgi:hypothetical protein